MHVPISMMIFARKGDIYFAQVIRECISNVEYIQNYERLRGVIMLNASPPPAVLEQFTRDAWDDIFLRLEGDVCFSMPSKTDDKNGGKC